MAHLKNLENIKIFGNLENVGDLDDQDFPTTQCVRGGSILALERVLIGTAQMLALYDSGSSHNILSQELEHLCEKNKG